MATRAAYCGSSRSCLPGEARFDDAGRYRVHQDTVRRKLARHLLDQHIDAGFADGIGGDLRPGNLGHPTDVRIRRPGLPSATILRAAA